MPLKKTTAEEEIEERADKSAESSSIGAPEDSDDDDSDVDGEAESKLAARGTFTTLDSLEDSLPIKRGLSNYYVGKSRSFGNLCHAARASDLAKHESVFNKRRRYLIAHRWTTMKKTTSFYRSSNPMSMPLLRSVEDAAAEARDGEDDPEEHR